MLLPVAQIVSRTRAEGPGWRFALWLQGCPLRCPGCCNPEFLPFSGGVPTSIDDVITQLHDVEGLTLLGGEPFAHAAGVAELAERVRAMNLSVMVFTGYTLEQLKAMSDPAVSRLLAATDLLVDGPYLRDQPDTRRRWIGSTNQGIHFLSDRYREDDPCWGERNTIEIRLSPGELSVNGFPATHARGLWKGFRHG